MTEPKNKIDQLVMAVLQAVDERLELIRGQFGQLVEAADKHTAALAAWQLVIEHQQAELALRHAELDMRLADLAHASKRAGRDAPTFAAAATAAAAAVPTPAPAPAHAPEPVVTAPAAVADTAERPALAQEPLASLAPVVRTPAAPRAAAPAAAPAAAAPAVEIATPTPSVAADSTDDVDFAELVKLVERQLDGWSGKA